MVHLQALPGTPLYQGSVKGVIEAAIREATLYKEAGLDGIMLENMHDTPYLKREVGHEISTIMSIIGYEVKKSTGLPIGLQILAGANKAALAAAHSAGLDFIRAEGFVFGHLADEGLIESDAGALLRYRKMIEAEDILILTDIKKKHSAHALTSDVDIVETAQGAAFFRSDGLVITGSSTGKAADLEEVKTVKQATNLPILIGSGINPDNAQSYLNICDGLIVGSWFKKDGYWANPIDPQKVKSMVIQLQKEDK